MKLNSRRALAAKVRRRKVSYNYSMASPTGSNIIKAEGDIFKGIIIKPGHYGEISAVDFKQILTDSLAAWKSEGRRGVWLTILLAQSKLIAVAAELGFVFHHSKPDQVTMTHWLPEHEENTLPIYATHNIGVAGFVVNCKNEVLLVQEKWQRDRNLIHWKLPGGVSDPGEDLWQTAIRETFEETGIRTEFISLFAFRHMHAYKWGIDDIYFACLLRPLDTEPKPNPSEIAAATWMDVDEYIADPDTLPTNRWIAKSYQESVKNSHMMQPVLYPHYFKDRQFMAHYRIESCDLTKMCDLTKSSRSQEAKDHVEQAVEMLTKPKI